MWPWPGWVGVVGHIWVVLQVAGLDLIKQTSGLTSKLQGERLEILRFIVISLKKCKMQSILYHKNHEMFRMSDFLFIFTWNKILSHKVFKKKWVLKKIKLHFLLDQIFKCIAFNHIEYIHVHVPYTAQSLNAFIFDKLYMLYSLVIKFQKNLTACSDSFKT